MRNTAFILCIMIVCASCSSFQHMHYRHLKKVPATPAITYATEDVGNCSPVLISEFDSVSASHPRIDSVQTEQAETEQVISEVAGVPVIQIVASAPAVQVSAPSSDPEPRARRDWSWFIALLMITAGIALLLYIIFVIPYINVLLLLRIVFGAFLLYTALRLVLTGISILKSRVSRPKTYKET